MISTNAKKVLRGSQGAPRNFPRLIRNTPSSVPASDSSGSRPPSASPLKCPPCHREHSSVSNLFPWTRHGHRFHRLYTLRITAFRLLLLALIFFFSRCHQLYWLFFKFVSMDLAVIHPSIHPVSAAPPRLGHGSRRLSRVFQTCFSPETVSPSSLGTPSWSQARRVMLSRSQRVLGPLPRWTCPEHLQGEWGGAPEES